MIPKIIYEFYPYFLFLIAIILILSLDDFIIKLFSIIILIICNYIINIRKLYRAKQCLRHPLKKCL